MLVLYKRDNLLYTKCLMNLKLRIVYLDKVFDNKKESTEFLLPEEVMHILARNGHIKLWDGNKYIKLNLGEFYDIMQNNRYNVELYPEPKKEEPKVEERKDEPKKEEPKVEERKDEPKKEEPKHEVKQQKDYQNNDNKKQRHNNNKQGGDK